MLGVVADWNDARLQPVPRSGAAASASRWAPLQCLHPHFTRYSHKPAAVQTPVPDGRQGTHGRRAGCGSRGARLGVSVLGDVSGPRRFGLHGAGRERGPMFSRRVEALVQFVAQVLHRGSPGARALPAALFAGRRLDVVCQATGDERLRVPSARWRRL